MILLLDKYWEIKNTKTKGRGIFAKMDIPQSLIIGDYIGKIIHPKDAIVDEENFYLMYYHDSAVIVPDLEKPGVHLLNHACIPNSFLYTYQGHTLAFTLRKILKGEELTIPYLLSPKDSFCNPCLHICKCGNSKCTKTMHLSKDQYTKWRVINDKWAAKTKRARIRYKKLLPLLQNYPKTISADYIKEITQLFNLY